MASKNQTLERLRQAFIVGIDHLDLEALEAFARTLADVRESGGRLFVLGLGGSAGHASHATNDFRKLCGLEAYCPTDNVSELTARINDEGFETSLSRWLEVSRLRDRDCLLFFSVGGGSRDHNVSLPLISAADFGKSRRCKILSVVGRPTGELVRLSDSSIVFGYDDDFRTPLTEGLTAVVWHMLVSHPELQTSPTKW